MPEIDYAFVADFAKVDAAAGTLTAVGASWAFVRAVSFPTPHHMAVAGRIRSTIDAGTVPLRITITGPDDSFQLSADAELTPTENAQTHGDGKIGLLFALAVQIPLTQPGLYSVDVIVEGGGTRTLKFEAQLAQ